MSPYEQPLSDNAPEGAEVWTDLHKRECYARWLVDQLRAKRKTREDLEQWLSAQADEQHMRAVMNQHRGR